MKNLMTTFSKHYYIIVNPKCDQALLFLYRNSFLIFLDSFFTEVYEDYVKQTQSSGIDGVMDPGFKPQSGQTKYYKTGICCFSVKPAALRSKSKDWFDLESG